MAKKESKKYVITSLKRKNNIKKRGERRKKVMRDNLGHEKKKTFKKRGKQKKKSVIT